MPLQVCGKQKRGVRGKQESNPSGQWGWRPTGRPTEEENPPLLYAIPATGHSPEGLQKRRTHLSCMPFRPPNTRREAYRRGGPTSAVCHSGRRTLAGRPTGSKKKLRRYVSAGAGQRGTGIQRSTNKPGRRPFGLFCDDIPGKTLLCTMYT